MARDEDDSWRAATLANLRAARKGNGRLGSKKVRSGCVTCKQRRVKCDEARPWCSRCRTAGKFCEGYTNSDFSSAGAKSTVNTIATLGLKPHELQTFDHFITVTAPQLSGALDAGFWTGQLLQLCHAEPFILEAVLSISTLHRHPQYMRSFSAVTLADESIPRHERIKLVSAGDPFGNELPMDMHHVAALSSYNRSIAKFKERMSSGQMSASMALLSCFLFITIEISRDALPAGLQLFKQSVQLAQSLAHHDDILTAQLRAALARLSVIVGAFGVAEAAAMPQDSGVDADITFATLEEARSSLFACMARGHYFCFDAEKHRHFMLSLNEEPANRDISHMSEIASAHPPITGVDENGAADFGFRGETSIKVRHSHWAKTEQPADEYAHREDTSYEIYSDTAFESTGDDPTEFELPRDFDKWLSSMLERQRRHIAELEHWNDALLKLSLCGKQEHSTCAELPGTSAALAEADTISHLKLYYHMSHIWLATRMEHLQTAFDNCTYHFQQILHHAKIYIDCRAAAQSTFTFENGVIPPLFLTATKCRIPSIRRKALALLKLAPRKESMWGAQTTGQVASTLMWLEELDLGLPMPDEPIDPIQWPDIDARLPSEERRVHNTSIWKNNPKLRYELQVVRYRVDESGVRRRAEVNVPMDAGYTQHGRSTDTELSNPLRRVISPWVPEDQDVEIMSGAPAWAM